MRTMRTTGASLLLVLALGAGACGSDDTEEPSTPTAPGSEDAVTDTLPTGTPEGTVDVPPETGATPIADYVQGTSDLVAEDPEDLAQIMALVGTDAEGYITDDAVVVQAEEADVALWCRTVASFDLSYRLIPVLPDGTGVDCSS